MSQNLHFLTVAGTEGPPTTGTKWPPNQKLPFREPYVRLSHHTAPSQASNLLYYIKNSNIIYFKINHKKDFF